MAASGRWSVGVVVLSLVCLGGACKGRPQPSPEYDEASRLWTELVMEKPLGAELDPRADKVLELLSKVPADAQTAEAAQFLAKQIKDARAADAARKARPDPVPTEARAEPSGEGGGGGMAGGGVEGAAEEAAVDAGTPAFDVFSLTGQPFAEAEKRYGACLERGPDFESKNGKGQAWKRRETPDCPAKFPEIGGKLVLVVDAKVFGIADAGTETRVETTILSDGGVVTETFPPADAGAPAPVDGGPAAP